MDGDEVTNLLHAIRQGVPDASHRLIDAVHAELRQMAEAQMRAERRGHTLQPTALVNEAYLRLRGTNLEDRAHFFGAAAKAMERVLVDHARQRRAQKRGGDAARVTLADLAAPSATHDFEVVDIHEAIAVLERESEQLAALVRYRYFVGLTLEQISDIEGVSLATLKRRWTFARAWLYERLEP